MVNAEEMRVKWEESKIVVDGKCRGDESQWEKSKIAVDYKCRADEGQLGEE